MKREGDQTRNADGEIKYWPKPDRSSISYLVKEEREEKEEPIREKVRRERYGGYAHQTLQYG